ncbi:peptidylprolyl isomerase [Paenibacillus sp. GSMTC-2017]|nr:peptidylprolyl isomerase [Paenibacillus sp. GSMTC-2017]
MTTIKSKLRLSTILLLITVFALITAGCGVNQGKNNATQGSGGNTATTEPSPSPSPSPTATPTETAAESDKLELLGPEKHPVVTIELSNDKIIKVELYPEVAPNTVNNFISLVNKNFYDGVIFHRVIPGFMIQGGDPEGTGMGGPGYTIAGEFTGNSFKNNLKHTRGVISMARAQDPNSAGSQFFIMVADSDFLDTQYASFGTVIEGMEHVDEVVNQERDANDLPNTPISMKKVTVDLKGMTFPEPVKAE